MKARCDDEREEEHHSRWIKVTGPVEARLAPVLSPGALAFVAGLHREFNDRREGLLRARAARQLEFSAGTLPDFSRRRAASARTRGAPRRCPPIFSAAMWRSPVPWNGR